MTRVLVVEDEESFSDALSFMLRKEGFEVGVAATGPTALASSTATAPTSCCSTSCCPGMSGTEVCRALRQQSDVPVIMLTAKDSEVDKVVGLELGADDYVTKPSPRASSSPGSAPCCVAPASRRSCCPRRSRPARCAWTSSGTSSPSAASRSPLPLKEFELLELLLRNAGRVLTRGQLIDRVWGSDYVGDTKTLDVHVKRLRAKIEADPRRPRTS